MLLWISLMSLHRGVQINCGQPYLMLCFVLFVKECIELFEYIISKLGLQIIVLEIQQYQSKWGVVKLWSFVSASYNQLRSLLSRWTGQIWERCLVSSDGKWGWRCSGKQTLTFLQIAVTNWGECTVTQMWHFWCLTATWHAGLVFLCGQVTAQVVFFCVHISSAKLLIRFWWNLV